MPRPLVFAAALLLAACASDVPPAVPAERFEQVRAVLMEASPQVRVDAGDPEYPNQMHVRVARSDIEGYYARKIASETYARLGGEAVVAVYDDTGKRLATASQFGVTED